MSDEHEAKHKCPICDGTGWVDAGRCLECDGTGKLTAEGLAEAMPPAPAARAVASDEPKPPTEEELAGPIDWYRDLLALEPTPTGTRETLSALTELWKLRSVRSLKAAAGEPLTEEDLAELDSKAAELLESHKTATGFNDEIAAAIEASMATVVLRLVAEVRRLRGIVQRVATFTLPPFEARIACPTAEGHCVFCSTSIECAEPKPHKPDCVWLDVEREARP